MIPDIPALVSSRQVGAQTLPNFSSRRFAGSRNPGMSGFHAGAPLSLGSEDYRPKPPHCLTSTFCIYCHEADCGEERRN